MMLTNDDERLYHVINQFPFLIERLVTLVNESFEPMAIGRDLTVGDLKFCPNHCYDLTKTGLVLVLDELDLPYELWTPWGKLRLPINGYTIGSNAVAVFSKIFAEIVILRRIEGEPVYPVGGTLWAVDAFEGRSLPRAALLLGKDYRARQQVVEESWKTLAATVIC